MLIVCWVLQFIKHLSNHVKIEFFFVKSHHFLIKSNSFAGLNAHFFADEIHIFQAIAPYLAELRISQISQTSFGKYLISLKKLNKKHQQSINNIYIYIYMFQVAPPHPTHCHGTLDPPLPQRCRCPGR